MNPVGTPKTSNLNQPNEHAVSDLPVHQLKMVKWVLTG